MNDKIIANVVVDKVNLNSTFFYLVPENMVGQVSVGSYVEIIFNNRETFGFVVDIDKYEKQKHKICIDDILNIRSVDQSIPLIPSNLILLSNIVSKYYCYSQCKILRTILPTNITKRSNSANKKSNGEICVSLKNDKLIQSYIFDQNNVVKISKKRKSIIELIYQKKIISVRELCNLTNCSIGIINSLVKEGIIEKQIKIKEQDDITYRKEEYVESKGYKLNNDQTIAFKYIKNIIKNNNDSINADIDHKENVVLIHGVTGSGKTEIYIKLIQLMILNKKSTILLVPEVSLIYHIMDMIQPRINNNLLSVLHYKLGDRIRYNEWIKIYKSDVSVVIGTRNALFAPCKNLGLIIIDEEHEITYKQDNQPRYHARDVAIMRSRVEKCVTILGSATPSIESYYNAVRGKYNLVCLKKRIDDKTMPIVKIVDMRQSKNIFSDELVREISKRIEKSEQVILFLNRRGFSTRLYCQNCGYILKCENCSVNYTYHKNSKILMCHICGNIVSSNINKCPSCKSYDIRYTGTGTEKIESIIHILFPTARIVRMDSDTMINSMSYEKLIKNFKKRNIDILIGTQMLTKGFDFKNVTLVGILNADLSLHINNFRSSEKTFQIITQVIGRSGRGDINGEAYIQTFFPFNNIIQYAINQNYNLFFKEEIMFREKFKYPPYNDLIVFIISSIEKERCVKTASGIINLIENCNNIIVTKLQNYDTIQKIRNKFILYLPIRGAFDIQYKEELINIMSKFNNKYVSVSIDVDSYLI